MSIYLETFCFPLITNTNRSECESILIYNGRDLGNKFYLGYYVIFNNLLNCIVIKNYTRQRDHCDKFGQYKEIACTPNRDSVELFLKKKIQT